MNEFALDYRPLDSLCNWEAFAASHSAEPASAVHHRYQDYHYQKPGSVRELYRLNHTYQTYDFVRSKEDDFLSSTHCHLSVWEALELLDQPTEHTYLNLVSPRQHSFQTAEAIRADGYPDWFVLAGLIHDLGKILSHFGEPQWAVVGHTFPVGCRFADEVVHSEFFQFNPDYQHPTYQMPLGVYQAQQGLRHVHLSWGHAEYLYHIVKDYLPDPALYAIRYHSFFAAHRDGAYSYLLNDYDREMFRWVKCFCLYDGGPSGGGSVNIEEVRPYYEKLVAKYLPEKLPF